MSDYQEMYELERRRADICEGQILELRRQVFALNEEIDRSRSERQYWHDSAQKMTDKWFATKRKVAKLQKALKAAGRGDICGWCEMEKPQ